MKKPRKQDITIHKLSEHKARIIMLETTNREYHNTIQLLKEKLALIANRNPPPEYSNTATHEEICWTNYQENSNPAQLQMLQT